MAIRDVVRVVPLRRTTQMLDNNLLNLDCPTQWNNTYNMLRAAIEKRAILDEGISRFKTNAREMKISKDEWELP